MSKLDQGKLCCLLFRYGRDCLAIPHVWWECVRRVELFVFLLFFLHLWIYFRLFGFKDMLHSIINRNVEFRQRLFLWSVSRTVFILHQLGFDSLLVNVNEKVSLLSLFIRWVESSIALGAFAGTQPSWNDAGSGTEIYTIFGLSIDPSEVIVWLANSLPVCSNGGSKS
jgi:hypothetical protein